MNAKMPFPVTNCLKPTKSDIAKFEAAGLPEIKECLKPADETESRN